MTPPHPDPLRPRWFDRSERAPMLFIVAVWVLLVALSRPWGEFPVIDDWVYALAVKSVLENGVYQFPSPSSANVGPQIWWGVLFCLPFGFSFDALRLSTLVLGVWGALAMYRLIRLCGGSRAAALVCALAMALHPLSFPLAASYMTDVPFVVLSVVAMCYLIPALQNDSRRDLSIGIALALMVILIRQLGVVLLVGLAAGYVVRRGLSVASVAKAALTIGAGLAIHFGYQYWLTHTGRTPVVGFHSDPANLWRSMGDIGWILRMTVIETLTYSGFLLLPVTAMFLVRPRAAIGRPRGELIAVAAITVVALVLCVLLFLRQHTLPSSVIGSVLLRWGFGPLMLRDVFDLVKNVPVVPLALKGLWSVLTVLSVASLAVLAYRLGLGAIGALAAWRARLPARHEHAAFVFVVTSALAYAGVMLVAASRFAIFDRYYLLLAPLGMAALFLLDRRLLPAFRGWRLAAGGVLVALLAGMSVAMTHDHAAANVARWKLLDRLTQVEKIDPRRIDGGYEFNGMLLYAPGYVIDNRRSWWWVEDDEFVIGAGPLAGYAVLDSLEFDRWFTGGRGRIVLLRRTPP